MRPLAEQIQGVIENYANKVALHPAFDHLTGEQRQAIRAEIKAAMVGSMQFAVGGIAGSGHTVSLDLVSASVDDAAENMGVPVPKLAP